MPIPRPHIVVESVGVYRDSDDERIGHVEYDAHLDVWIVYDGGSIGIEYPDLPDALQALADQDAATQAYFRARQAARDLRKRLRAPHRPVAALHA